MQRLKYANNMEPDAVLMPYRPVRSKMRSYPLNIVKMIIAGRCGAFKIKVFKSNNLPHEALSSFSGALV